MTAPKNSSRRRPPSANELRLADELHTHQVELEMQNQELMRTKTDLELSRARYFELYDFAPVPYFTLQPLGLVVRDRHIKLILSGGWRAWGRGRGRVWGFVSTAGRASGNGAWKRLCSGVV